MLSAEWAYLQLVLYVARGRLESARDDRGTSAVELAIIAAMLVVAASAVALAISKVIEKNQGTIERF